MRKRDIFSRFKRGPPPLTCLPPCAVILEDNTSKSVRWQHESPYEHG